MSRGESFFTRYELTNQYKASLTLLKRIDRLIREDKGIWELREEVFNEMNVLKKRIEDMDTKKKRERKPPVMR